MKISFAATNPCHLYDLALALHKRRALGTYHSGYPRWRLKPPADFPLTESSWRTLITYTLLRVPEAFRPNHTRLFRWQDKGFDADAAAKLQTADFLHGLPGQCCKLFQTAKQQGIKTVLNHATGPVRQQLTLLEPEYRRAGIPFNPDNFYDANYFDAAQQEYALADFHCVASTIVKEQLQQQGIPHERIQVVPYAANTQLFPKSLTIPPGDFSIGFAGMASLRKGIYYLLQALELAEQARWTLHCYGPPNSETNGDFQHYRGKPQIKRHGSLPQAELAKAFHKLHALVLPSAEEGFGLVVVQALQSGLPCIVSDRVGAKDLIQHRQNGSIFPFGQPEALLEELRYWEAHPRRINEIYNWDAPAQQLLATTTAWHT